MYEHVICRNKHIHGRCPRNWDLLAATSQLARGWLPRSSRTCLLLLVWSLTTCWRGTGNTDNFSPTMISHAFMHFVLRSKNWRWPRWPTDHQQCKVRRLTLGIHRLSPPYFNAQRSLLYCPGMVQNVPTAAVSFWLWHAIWLLARHKLHSPQPMSEYVRRCGSMSGSVPHFYQKNMPN